MKQIALNVLLNLLVHSNETLPGTHVDEKDGDQNKICKIQQSCTNL